MKKLKIKNKILIGIYAIAAIIFVIAWISTSFCDWYIDNIFPIGTNTYARITSILPFSLGEVMVCIAVILIIVLIVSLILPVIKKTENLKKFRKTYSYICLWIVACVFLEMTLNMVILYHASTFDKKYNIPNSEHTIDDIYNLREHIVKKINNYSENVKRDEEGLIIANEEELIKECKKTMKTMGEDYSGLSGYYPEPKKLFFSDFISQQYILGVYLPFSLEATYNKNAYIMNIPATVCHELSHVKGFIYEDEANFISYLACIRSDNELVQYSGYLTVNYYVNKAFNDNAPKDLLAKATPINDIVDKDDVFLLPETWEKVEEDAIISTKTVEAVSDKAMDVSLKINGVKDGKISYSRVVELLLNYYTVNKFE